MAAPVAARAPFAGPPTPIQSKKKAILVAQQIVNEIAELGLDAGDRLPAEGDMTARYQVGRGTVREALRLLETQGVVSIKTGPGGGPVVLPLDATAMAANIALLLQRTDGSFRSVMEARVLIEPAIAALSALNRTDGLVAALRASVMEHAEHREAPTRLVTDAGDFHDLVARSTGNPLFEVLLLSLHRITEPYMQQLSYDDARKAQLIATHKDIVDAIDAGDPIAAEVAMRRDLDESMEHIIATSPELLDSQVTWAVVVG